MLAPLSVLILVAAVATGVEIGLPAARQGNQITPVTVRITSTVVSTATATITSKAFCWTTAAAPAPAVNPCRRKRDLFLDTPVVYGEDKSIIPVRELFNPSPLLNVQPTLIPALRVGQAVYPLHPSFADSSINTDADVISVPSPQGRIFATPQQIVQAVAQLLGIASTTTTTITTTIPTVTTTILSQTSKIGIASCIPPLSFAQCANNGA